MANAFPVFPAVIEYVTASLCGSVADTVPTASPVPASWGILKLYDSSSNSGDTHSPVLATRISDGSLYAAAYVVPLPNALTRNWYALPHSNSSTV